MLHTNIFPFDIVALLLATHWVADFVCQSHWMASNKSSNHEALILHVITYGLVLSFPAGFALGSLSLATGFVAFNTLAHWATDFVTSRISSRLWREQRWHDFFVVIGLDQLIHVLTLLFSLAFVVGMQS